MWPCSCMNKSQLVTGCTGIWCLNCNTKLKRITVIDALENWLAPMEDELEYKFPGFWFTIKPIASCTTDMS